MSASAPTVRFIVDINVGRLATWLRALGYDTVFINPIDDSDLVRIAIAESRIILTKDTGIFERSLVSNGTARAFYVDGIEYKQQLANVCRALSLNAHAAFTRCVVCNSALKPIAREGAEFDNTTDALLREAFAQRVPADVRASEMQIAYCPNCARFFWTGSHWGRMQKTIAEVLAAG